MKTSEGFVDPPPLQHLLQQVLPLLRRLHHGALLIAHVPQLARGVRLHGLAAPPLFPGAGHNTGFLHATTQVMFTLTVQLSFLTRPHC